MIFEEVKFPQFHTFFWVNSYKHSEFINKWSKGERQLLQRGRKLLFLWFFLEFLLFVAFFTMGVA